MVKGKKQLLYSPARLAGMTGKFERGQNISWGCLIAEFLDSREKLGRTEKYVYDLKNSLTRAGTMLDAMGISPRQLDRRAMGMMLANYRVAHGVGDQSVQHMAVKMMTMMTWAFTEEIFPVDRLATFSKPAVRDKPKYSLVTASEIERIRLAIRRYWDPEHAPASRFRGAEARAFFATQDECLHVWLPETGMRIGEACKTDVADINLAERTVRLTQTKNGDDRYTYFTAEFRDLVLVPWLAVRESLAPMTERLFVTEYGTELNPYRWGRQWDKYRQLAGIERRIRRHDLRHYSSTAHDEVDRDASMEIMGHRSDAAHDIYSHTTPARITALRAVHDEADPVGPILAKTKMERGSSGGGSGC